MHVRIAAEEFQHERGHDLSRTGRECIYAEGSRGRLLLRADTRHGILDVAQRGLDLQDEGATGVGQRDAAGCAVEEAGTETGFQLGDGIAQRCGRHAKRQSRLAKGSLPRNGDDGFKLGKANPVHYPANRNS